jgi:membrane protein DedA with SNARE-associated domain
VREPSRRCHAWLSHCRWPWGLMWSRCRSCRWTRTAYGPGSSGDRQGEYRGSDEAIGRCSCPRGVASTWSTRMAAMSNWLTHALQTHGLSVIFLPMTAESACIPIPSEVVVPYGGVLAAQDHVSIWAVIAVATTANLVGSGITYWVGRTGGRALFMRYMRYVLVRPHHLDKADEWFERRGQLTVFSTPMMPGVRTFISLPAGIARMPSRRFLLYTLLGAVPWNVALPYLGWTFGSNWDRLQQNFQRESARLGLQLSWSGSNWVKNARYYESGGEAGGDPACAGAPWRARRRCMIPQLASPMAAAARTR